MKKSKKLWNNGDEMMINGIIFDMDGLMFDTEKLLVRFWCQSANEYGYDMKPHHVLEIRSLSRKYAIPKLKGIFGEEFDFESVRARRISLMNDYIDKNGFEMFKHDNKSMDLRNNESFNVPDREGELMDDVVSKLIGMNNISPNFKKEDEKFPLNNNSKPMRDNESAPQVFGDKKSSDMWKDNINKSNKDPKVVKKSSKKVKTDKKSSKKVKSLKKSKKAGKNLPKKFKRERAKL